MVTVEEAWLKFCDELALSLPDPEGAIDTQAAARNLAAAVLEEVEESGCVYPYCNHPCTDCPIEALRKQIAALGS